MERRGIRTKLGDMNRDIEMSNQKLKQLNARIRKAKNELYALPLPNSISTIEAAKNVLAFRNLDTQRQKIKKLQSFVDMHNFLFENDIRDFAELADKANSMYDESRNLQGEVKKIDRRLETLDIHLAHADNWKKCKGTFKKYNELPLKKRDEFYAKYKNAIEAYKNSIEYFDKVLNGRKTIPINDWESEQKKLTAIRYSLCDKYYDLRSDINSVEQLKRSALNLIKDDEIERKPQRKRDFER